MRLLQLRTDGSSLLDLHPNLTVVQGLDPAARSRLVATVRGLADGVAAGEGLLEAHGVLFDLSTEMLAMLDVVHGERPPVVTVDDLPSIPDDPERRARVAAERALAEADQRCQAAADEQARAVAEVEAARTRLRDLRAQLAAAEADVSGRLDSVDERTAQVDRAIERRRRLADEVTTLAARADAAAAELAEVEASTRAVREAREQAAARAVQLAAQVDEARQATAPDAVAEAEAAAARLARVELEVAEAEAAAQQSLHVAPMAAAEAPSAVVERVQARMAEIDQRLAAMTPQPVDHVRAEMDRLRSLPEVALVPSPEAAALADELEALPTPDDHGAPPEPLDLAGARTRLDDARHSLLEAEQAVRNPPLDREAVDRLEVVHAELLDALDRVDNRLTGGRARRQAAQLRAMEAELLDALGFGSYSDYMMGSSLLHVDPVKEAVVDAARAELTAAEQAWQAVQALTDAELRRAEALDRRRVLIERAHRLLGRTVPARSVVTELRSMLVEAAPTGDPAAPLRAALADVGVELGPVDLSRQDVLLVAEAWVEETGIDHGRLDELVLERSELEAARMVALTELESAAVAKESTPADASVDRASQLAAARHELAEAERRLAEHREASADVERLVEQLDDATEAERTARAAAADADAAVAGARQRADGISSELAGLEASLAEAIVAEAEAERLLADHQATPDPEQLEELRAKVAEVEGALQLRERAADDAAQVHARQQDDQRAAAAALAELGGDDGADEPPLADEIEWYLLARLAAQRSVSLGGSLPLLLDDALAGVPEPGLGRILGRLERMADAVQVILVTDDPAAASWAALAGPERAAVVGLQAV